MTIRDIDNWWPTPKGYRPNLRDSIFDTGEAYKDGRGKWRMRSKNRNDAATVLKDRCCYPAQEKQGGICGVEASGRLEIATGRISPIDKKPEKKLLPLCDAHRDIISST